MLGATAISSDPEIGTIVVSHMISSGSIVSIGDFKKVWNLPNNYLYILHGVVLHYQTAGELKAVFSK